MHRAQHTYKLGEPLLKEQSVIPFLLSLITSCCLQSMIRIDRDYYK